MALGLCVFSALLIFLGVDQTQITTSEQIGTNINDTINNQRKTITHVNSGTQFMVEVADSNEERRDGLMFRTSLEPQTGMIFIFDSEQSLTFWMKNTLISLDIIYLDSDARVVSISEYATPNQTQIVYPSAKPAQYVIELGAGSAEFYGIETGDQFDIDQVI